MHIAVIVSDVPNPATGGGALTAWTVIKYLIEAGHQVTTFSLFTHHLYSEQERNRRLGELSQLGTEILTLLIPEGGSQQYRKRRFMSDLRKILQPMVSDYYPTAALKPQIEICLKQVHPDAIFVYHWEALAATHGLDIAPRMAAVGDPTHLPNFYRWRYSPVRPSRGYMLSTLQTLLAFWGQPRVMVKMLADCEVAGAFAAHHAAWFRHEGVPNCLYLRTPLPDAVGPNWKRLRDAHLSRSKPKILMIGHLKGIATLSGLYLFANEILPLLEHRLGPDGFEVHIVGGYSLPQDLAKKLARPSVKLRGHIEPAHGEFLSAHILLVPTPIKLGIRVRILVGFSFGCCVVAHRANVLGIPELVHEENALLAADGRGLADAIIRALSDPALRRRLGEKARRTYEEHFAPEVSGARIVAELERIAKEGKKQSIDAISRTIHSLNGEEA